MNLPAHTARLLLCVFAFFAFGGSIHGNEPSDTATADSRAQLTSQVKRNVEAGKRTMAMVREQTKRLDEEAREEFDVIAGVVESAEKRLRRSLNYVETASAEDWPRARAILEASYEAYVQAIAQAERFLTVDATYASREPDRR